MRLKMQRLTMHRNQRQSGDQCECDACRGRLVVENTRAKPAIGMRVQYLACNQCGWRPENNKLIRPLDMQRQVEFVAT